MPKWVELQRKTGQRGLLISSRKRLGKKDSDRAITPAAEAVHVPAHLALPGSPQAKHLHHLHTQLSLLPQAKNILRLCMQGHFGCVQLFAILWTVACQASLSERGFSRQEYWSILANIGCHTLLEHSISCCPSHQLHPTPCPEFLVLPESL